MKMRVRFIAEESYARHVSYTQAFRGVLDNILAAAAATKDNTITIQCPLELYGNGSGGAWIEALWVIFVWEYVATVLKQALRMQNDQQIHHSKTFIIKQP